MAPFLGGHVYIRFSYLGLYRSEHRKCSILDTIRPTSTSLNSDAPRRSAPRILYCVGLRSFASFPPAIRRPEYRKGEIPNRIGSIHNPQNLRFQSRQAGCRTLWFVRVRVLTLPTRNQLLRVVNAFLWFGNEVLTPLAPRDEINRTLSLIDTGRSRGGTRPPLGSLFLLNHQPPKRSLRVRWRFILPCLVVCRTVSSIRSIARRLAALLSILSWLAKRSRNSALTDCGQTVADLPRSK